MSRKLCVLIAILCISYLCVASGYQDPYGPSSIRKPKQNHPNILFMVFDDLGYGDLSSFDFENVLDYKTPNIDSIVRDGMKFTQWITQPVCTPSRASLLTGRLPIRTGMVGAVNAVLHHADMPVGLPLEETTIPEMLHTVGYRTYKIGKWHLGINSETQSDGTYLPRRQGFDYFYGHPFTHTHGCKNSSCNMEGHFIYENEEIIQHPVRLWETTDRFVDRVLFILEDHARNPSNPFFLDLSFLQMHGSMYANARFAEQHPDAIRPEWTDMINELDWAVGMIIQAMKDLGLYDETLIFLTSDNGPEMADSRNGGSSGILRGGKYQTMEGGVRVPAALTWSGVIPAGSTSSALLNTLDIFPTIASILNIPIPSGLVIDGKDLSPILFSNSTAPIHDRMPHYCSKYIHALRIGDFKAHFMTPRWLPGYETCTQPVPFPVSSDGCACDGSMSDIQDPPLIFRITTDPSETHPINGVPDEFFGIGLRSTPTPTDGSVTQEQLNSLLHDFQNYYAELMHEFPDGSYPLLFDYPSELPLTPCCGDGFYDEAGQFHGTCGCPQPPVSWTEHTVYHFTEQDLETTYHFQHPNGARKP
eukprot:TRINITY_DN902_c0_g1::TRINITY_DN902_c0_g1_i1::g.15915::m.15915 TRINITY_DN902_c0_g1::TRINITY_DN902_c0_g1_i1::g.15915  ORF type:complete len:588 (+),score=42.57,sp/P14000/ARS_HEMPU/33.19/2e-74,Sulfatase/PF00884.18/9.9e-64,Sulfatase_C/PF14707.1/1.2e-17,Phosphodiest/PF01663.17/4e-08,DUF229/PF02995.12/0.025,DUF1501/PF07394.7/0.028 TRINITY_DN902_c0_g1_i1:98-1861(+)